MKETTQLIFDGHNDTVMNLYYPHRGGGRSFFEQSDKGHIDLPRALAGGFGGGLFAIFVTNDDWMKGPPKEDVTISKGGYSVKLASPVSLESARATTLMLMEHLFQLIDESDGQMRLVCTVDEIEQAMHEKALAVVLHFEGAEVIDTGFEALHKYYQQGLRSLGICWSRPNDFGCGVPFMFPSSPDVGPGLTDAGKQLVQECNQLGVMIDLAHLNEKGFWDTAAITDRPLVVSHSAAHALCTSARNMTDRQLDAIGESDGLIGVSFFRNDLRGDGEVEPDTPLSALVDQIVYLVERIGIDHVALGSDFDGATIPKELGDVAGLPKLVDALRLVGFNEAALTKVCRDNWLRVLRATWNS
ncbi:MAG: dipeptidase [candidate division Zixibacteria bacterium]|nr:dipeptidase [candidate division Zixibacteria bacterium]MDH3936910.1 dipeptidase [candidate division Zixibacteria bacterium]MDH4033351.1 dipeptidase [candidate division Zixibacteria bacterium]